VSLTPAESHNLLDHDQWESGGRKPVGAHRRLLLLLEHGLSTPSIFASKTALAQSVEWFEEAVQQEKGIIRARISQGLLKSRASYLILELFQNAKVQTKRHCVPAFPSAQGRIRHPENSCEIML
jgi:hypothetical protein